MRLGWARRPGSRKAGPWTWPGRPSPRLRARLPDPPGPSPPGSKPRLLRPALHAPPPPAPPGPAQPSSGRAAVAAGCGAAPAAETRFVPRRGGSKCGGAPGEGERRAAGPGTAPGDTARLQRPFPYPPPLLKERTRAFGGVYVMGGVGVYTPVPLPAAPVCKLKGLESTPHPFLRSIASRPEHLGAGAGPPPPGLSAVAAGRGSGRATPRLRSPPSVTAPACAARAGGEGASPGAAGRWAAALPRPAPSRPGGPSRLGSCPRPGEAAGCRAESRAKQRRFAGG